MERIFHSLLTLVTAYDANSKPPLGMENKGDPAPVAKDVMLNVADEQGLHEITDS